MSQIRPMTNSLRRVLEVITLMNIMMVQNAQRYDWETWIMGIVRSTVQGGAAAVAGAFSTMVLDPATFNLKEGIGKTLELMGAMFIIQGMIHMFMFLQTHGAPELVTVTESDVRTTKTTVNADPQVPDVTVTTDVHTHTDTQKIQSITPKKGP